ncbi:hypothetical protein KOR42_10620 [Thalassoglobus neptunius]|uniref:Uncharacterized protein n=1 Tax=Thalassoglobus neptunius TaxID=1938619 RepID=A0A5C5X4P6_9PLAN|nr:hypothetical protein KOR42_10620 [Thalassoglobus neptunius]
MNTNLIHIDQDEAKRKLTAYRSRMHKDAEEEYQRLVEVYNAAADGYPLIHLSDAINEGGFDELGRPRLAIAPADRREVCYGNWQTSAMGQFNCNTGRGQFSANDCTERFSSVVPSHDLAFGAPMRWSQWFRRMSDLRKDSSATGTSSGKSRSGTKNRSPWFRQRIRSCSSTLSVSSTPSWPSGI